MTTIVLAWTEVGAEVVRQRRVDLGESPIMREVIIPHAAVWLNKGTLLDVAKAQAYAARETDKAIRVLTYPTTERDPLGRAKADVLKG
jgi:hypothetical protein